MRLYAVKTGLLKVGENVVDAVLNGLTEQGLVLEDNDILVFTSKIVAYAQGRVVNLSGVKPSERAVELAGRFCFRPEFAELVLREADRIYGGVERAVLTLKDGVLTANAGVDNKNAPLDCAALWPEKLKEVAEQFRNEVKRRTGCKVAVLIVDSGLTPLRRGTVGVALAVAGFKPVEDFRGLNDLYGKEVAITQLAVADSLASAAHLLMGETCEETPVVLVRDAPVKFNEEAYGPEDMTLPCKECIFMSVFGLC